MKKLRFLMSIAMLSGLMVVSSGCGKREEIPEKGAEISIVMPETAEAEAGDLPIGSVMKLAGEDQKYMVVALNSALPNDPEKTWDFLAYAYPQGNQRAEIGFDGEQVSEVCFKGAEAVDDSELSDFTKGEDYLPPGTVVAVEGAPNPLMICGRLQSLAQTGTLYEYSACDYPEGLVNPEDTYLFNSELITGIYFYGYESEEEESYQYFLDEVHKQQSK